MKHISRYRLFLFAALVLVLSACAGVGQPSSLELPTAPLVEAASGPGDAAAAQPSSAAAPAPVELDPLDILFAQEQALISVYEQINPAVVNINVGEGQGSGFVYDTDGYIVTNNHVIEAADRIVVTFADDTQLEAELIGRDPDSDLAVIKVEAGTAELTAIDLADSDALQVGQMVIAIGNPFGLTNSMTTGIVSGLGRLLPSAQSPTGTSYNIPDIIQTDAAINPGNSGGPLLDLHGKLIGVNSAIASPVRGSSGVGYAVPANIVSVVVPQLIAEGSVAHPWLGIAGGTLTANIAAEMGFEQDQRGVLISSIAPGGPADLAGLLGGGADGGDLIVGIEEQPVHEFETLLGYIIQEAAVGQTVTVHILRDGQPQDVSLTLQARPTSG